MKALLLADDSPAKTQMLQLMLKHARWPGEVLVATTTEEAMDLIKTQDIGFGLIDYYIPTERGPAIIRALKAKNPSARIALVSSSNRAENTTEAMEAGAEAFVCTSDPSNEVAAALEALLQEWMG